MCVTRFVTPSCFNSSTQQMALRMHTDSGRGLPVCYTTDRKFAKATQLVYVFEPRPQPACHPPLQPIRFHFHTQPGHNDGELRKSLNKLATGQINYYSFLNFSILEYKTCKHLEYTITTGSFDQFIDRKIHLFPKCPLFIG